MNRKDTILVAVLINAGVLVVLFTSALKNKNPQEIVAKEPISSQVIETKIEMPMQAKEEIDIAIEQLQKEPQMLPEGVQFVQDLAIEPKEVVLSEGAEAPSVQSMPGFVEVQVKKGDFLAKIAKKYQTTVDEIMKMNQLKNVNLRVGQVLKVPSGVSAPVITQAPAQKEESAGYKTYVVKPGDSPWTIAHKHKMKVEELLKINHLTNENAKRLKVGDKLKVKA